MGDKPESAQHKIRRSSSTGSGILAFLAPAKRRRLHALAKELEVANRKVTELESLILSKNEFISNISHELRTPLTSIIGYVDVLSTKVEFESNPELDDIFKVLDRNATILISLVQSLLALSQFDSPNRSEAFKAVNLLTITEDAIFILRSEIEKKRISIKLNFDPEDTFIVEGDPGLISQACINLIANAIKFSSAEKNIEIRLIREARTDKQSTICFSVRDQGIGIPPDEISRISERYYRASNAVSDHVSGTGLGLTIVAKVVALHNAQLKIESELGLGTTFTVDFPAQLSPVATLILNRKFGLLAEAIEGIQVNDQRELKAKLHEYGGALGFYEFAEFGEELLSLSRTLSDVEKIVDSQTLKARDQLVVRMKEALPIKETGEANVE